MTTLTAIVLTYNRADFIERCVRSIIADADVELRIRVLVLDNGATDETPRVTGGFSALESDNVRITVRRTEPNRHVFRVMEEGLAIALGEPGAELVMLMNDDTEFTPGSVRRLVHAAAAHPHAFLTPLQRNYRAPEHLDDNAFGHIQQIRPLIEDALMGRALAETYPVITIIAAAILARVDTWRAVGGYDPLFWFYGPDDDLCNRARWLGYETLLVPGAHLLHAHGKLGAAPANLGKEAAFKKWRCECQARYLFRLKEPGTPLWRNFAETGIYALETSLTCLRALWPKGALHALLIYGDCLMRAGRIAQSRRGHYDPARKRA